MGTALLTSSRVEPTRALVEATRDRAPVPIWVQASTLAIYGDAGDDHLDEYPAAVTSTTRGAVALGLVATAAVAGLLAVSTFVGVGISRAIDAGEPREPTFAVGTGLTNAESAVVVAAIAISATVLVALACARHRRRRHLERRR